MDDPRSAIPTSPLPFGDDRLHFREPWEAQAFAIVVRLHEAGHFTWPEWVTKLGAVIEAARQSGAEDLGDGYYRHWLAAAEALIEEKGLLTSTELRLRRLEVEANVRKHVQSGRKGPLTVA